MSHGPTKYADYEVTLDCGHHGHVLIVVGSKKRVTKTPCFRCRNYPERRIVTRKKVGEYDR